MLGITSVIAGIVPIGARLTGMLPEGVSEGELRGEGWLKKNLIILKCFYTMIILKIIS